MKWNSTKLKYVSRLVAGGTPEVSNAAFWGDAADGIPWVTIGDMTRSTRVTATDRCLTPEGLADRRLSVGVPGTVLFAMYASVGAVAVLDCHAAWNQAILGVVPHPDRAESRFLRYWLEALKPSHSALFRSNTQDNLNADQVASFPYPTASVDDQGAIADYLDTETARIDALVSKKQALLSAVRSRESAHVSELWERDADRWGTSRLGRFLVRMEQGWSPQCEDRLATEAEYGVVKAGCVNGAHFRAQEHKALPPGVPPRLEYLLKPGDLLVSRASGSLDLIGSAAVIPDGAPTNLILCDKVYRLATDATVEAGYVALMLRAHRVREMIKLGVSGGEGMANNLPSGVIRSLPIPVAPLVEQLGTMEVARQIEHDTTQLVELLRRSVAALIERRQALITAAVTGELEIPGVAS